MGIAVNNMIASPSNLVVGAQNVIFSYKGFVSSATDNDVTITVTLEDACPLVFNANGKKTITLDPKKTFPVDTKYHDLSEVIDIKVTNAGGPSPCKISFTFTTAKNASGHLTLHLYY